MGQRHEVKEVADGYAINALFPTKAAEPATPEKVKQIEAQKAAHQAELQKQEEQLVHKLQMLRGKTVTISAKATEKGGLFKAVVAKDIARAILGQHSLQVQEQTIVVSEHIKTTGAHTVKLVHRDLSIPLVVEVSAA